MDGEIAENRESLPFESLIELYANLNDLQPWPEIVEMRESAEYAYRGLDVHLQKRKLEKVNRDEQPRTLICHDMKGGYLEDRYISGSRSSDSYVFYHWSFIDTFVYFSHHFITIPPYGWINAAHAHGVKVLGTIITEWSPGKKIWEKILESEEETKKFADALVSIAKFYKFEGWLLNIENEIESALINNLIYFVKYLTERIHEDIEESEIIWYDSVTAKGELKWQNELNNSNKDFFLNCDGIFLNYNWTESRLASSHIFAKNAGRDVKDVYVGLDVWGRGCPGGGGFNSAHALEKIRSQGLSVAIFAPAWTHEYFGPSAFHKLENVFWAQLVPYLYVHVPIYDDETFKTTFCRGTGSRYYKQGVPQLDVRIVEGKRSFEERPFYNLTMQEPQISVPVPFLTFTRASQRSTLTEEKQDASKQEIENIYETQYDVIRIVGNVVNFESKLSVSEVDRFEFCDRFSYEGGGCLKLVTKNPMSYHRLLLLHIDFTQEIQGSIVYEKDRKRGTTQNELKNDPILILTNDTGSKSFVPHESFPLNAGWKKCVYLTNMRTVNEIGMTFPSEGNYYLGKIVLEQKRRRRRRHSADHSEPVDQPNRHGEYGGR